VLNETKAFDIEDGSVALRFGFDDSLNLIANSDLRRVVGAEQAVENDCGGTFELNKRPHLGPGKSRPIMVVKAAREALERACALHLHSFRQLRKAAFTKLPCREINLTAVSAAGTNQLAPIFQCLKEDLSTDTRGIERLDRYLSRPGTMIHFENRSVLSHRFGTTFSG